MLIGVEAFVARKRGNQTRLRGVSRVVEKVVGGRRDFVEGWLNVCGDVS